MSDRFFYCPDGSVINARQIGAMRRVGFAILGATMIGDKVIANFDSVYEAEEYLRFVSEDIPTEPREVAKSKAVKDIYEYLNQRFMPFEELDLHPALFDEIDRGVCINVYSSNLALEALGYLTKGGNILDFGNKYVLPDRPTRTAVKFMTDRFYQLYHIDGVYERSSMVSELTSGREVAFHNVPNDEWSPREAYPNEWGEYMIDAFIGLEYVKCSDDLSIRVIAAPDKRDDAVDEFDTQLSTTKIEQQLDRATWKAPPERSYDFE